MTQSNEVNTVTLSKGSYDSMRSTNDRAGMLLSRIMDTITIADDSDDLSIDTDTILKTIEILYPETYKKKNIGSQDDSHEELFETEVNLR